MSVRRDPRQQRWFFRAVVAFSDGTRRRLSGVPGIPGPYQDLPNTKAGAIAAETRAKVQAMTGQLVVASAREVPTVRDYSTMFLDVYAASHKPSSRRDKRQRLDHDILPALGDLRLDAVRQSDIDELSAVMLKRECARKHVNNTLGVISALMKYAAKNGLIDKPELSFTIKSQDPEMEAVPAKDVDALLSVVIDQRYRVAILLAADSGLRIGEIRALRWIDVNEIAREIAVTQSYDRTNALSETKGWKARTVPASDRLWSEMRTIKRRGPLVFSRLDGEPLGYDAVRDRIKELYALAKVRTPKKPWHGLRHTFGTELANANTPIQVIRELMGHESIETTLRYMHSDREQKRDAIASLRGRQVAAVPKPTLQPPGK